MKDDLALLLKRSGFPQHGMGEVKILAASETDQTRAVVYLPTLSELIQACGKGFLRLEQLELDAWFAHSSTAQGAGDAPDEAVARLWLAINRSAKSGD